MICVINNVGFPMNGDFKYEINFRFGVRVSGYTVMQHQIPAFTKKIQILSLAEIWKNKPLFSVFLDYYRKACTSILFTWAIFCSSNGNDCFFFSLHNWIFCLSPPHASSSQLMIRAEITARPLLPSGRNVGHIGMQKLA